MNADHKKDALIQDIAKKHGVVLSQDDPILILHTMNEHLLSEQRKAQAELLAQFKAEMQAVTEQWQKDANAKAEQVLNAALVSGKEVARNVLEGAIKEFVGLINTSTKDQCTTQYYFAYKLIPYVCLISLILFVIAHFLML